MKLFIFFVILISSFAFANGQEKPPETDKPKAGSFRKPLEEIQKPKEPSADRIDLSYDDGCGNPLGESQIYSYRYGKVIAVTDENKIVVKVLRSNNVSDEEYDKADNETRRMLKQAQLFTVSLVGIDETINQSEIKRFLLEKVFEQDVILIGNAKKDNNKKLDALVKLTSGGEIDEVSRYLLEKGIAKFKEFQLTNLVPLRTACELKRAEAKAKAEKSGIWAK